MDRRKSTLGRPRPVPFSPPERLFVMNPSRKSPRLGTLGLGLEALSIHKSGQKSSSKKMRLCERLRESCAPSLLKQPQQANKASCIASKKNVYRRLDMKGPENGEQQPGASEVVGVEDIPLPSCQPTTPLQRTTVTSSAKSKRKVVHNLRTRAISNNVRKTMGTGIPLPKYYSSKKMQETNLPLSKYPSSKKVRETKAKLPPPITQPSHDCSVDSIARFEKDEAGVVASTPAVKTTSPFCFVETLIEEQPAKSERVDTQTLRGIHNSLSEGFRTQNQILEQILQEQRAQTEIMQKFFQLNAGRETCHEGKSHPLSPLNLKTGPSENAPRGNGTPIGKENSELAAIKGRKSLLVHMMPSQTSRLCTPRPKSVKSNVKATPRTQRTVLYRLAQEQENLLSDLNAP